MRRINLFLAVLFMSMFASAQTWMPIGGQTNSFTGMVRGYHFTAPAAFTICRLFIPPDAPGSNGQNQHIRVVRFTAGAPPAFPGTTNNFVQLFSITNVPSGNTVTCNIPVNNGDIIGIYGARAGNCINSYDGVAFATTVMGQPTTCRRSGMQACISGGQPMANIWSEVNYNIGRIFMWYNCCPTPTVTAVASNTGVCAGTSVTIFGGGANNYTWTPGNMNTASVVVTPTETTVYTLSGDVNGCVGSTTVGINVANYPTYTISPLTSTICNNGSVTESLTIGWMPTGTPCSTTGLGPACTNPPKLIVGTGAGGNSIFGYPAAYGGRYKNVKQQYLIRATELTAAGIAPGYLTSVAFNVTQLSGVSSFVNYTIKLKCTTATAVNWFFDNSGLSQVFSTPVYNVAAGWNTHNFTTPFYWDGTSNILVDICFGQNATNNTNNVTEWVATPFMSANYRFNNFSSQCNYTGFVTRTTRRPRMEFGNCAATNQNAYSYTWSPTSIMSAPNSTQTNVTPLPITASLVTNVYSVVVTPTAANCPIEKTFSVTIVNPPTPTLTPINPVCNTFGTLQLQATPGGGTWTTNSGISPTGVLTPSLAPIGTSTVLYSVTMGTCTTTETMSIDVSQFNTAALQATLGPQCFSFPSVNLMGLAQSTVNGTWSGPGVQSNSFVPSTLQSGVYTLTYNTTSSPNATLCPDVSTIDIAVINPETPTITIEPRYCDNHAAVQVTVTPATGTFVPSLFLSPTGIFTPSLASIGTNTLQLVVGTITCNVTQSITVDVEKFIPAIITTTAPDKCASDPVMPLTGYATTSSGTWSGPGVSGNSFDPATSGVGALTLTYVTTSAVTPSLCPDTAKLAVNVFSLQAPVIDPVGPFCNTAPPVKLKVSPLGGVFSSNTSALDYTGLFVPAVAKIGENVATYSIVNGPCVAFANLTINVERFVPAMWTKYPGPFCKSHGEINFGLFVSEFGGTFDGPGMQGTVFHPSLANSGDNNVIVYHTYSMPTASLCPDTAAVRVTVNDSPNITINSSALKGCQPLDVLFNTPDVNSGSGTWNFGDGSAEVTGFSALHQYVDPGKFNVQFTYIDEAGCKVIATLPGTVEIFANPDVYFTMDPETEITMVNPAVNFFNHTSNLGHNTYMWSIGELYTLKDVNPRVVFPEPGDYMITLDATTPDGCKGTYKRKVMVKNDFGIYIPNSFTPNWDGINDYFMVIATPFGIDTDIFDLEVFDRWGKSLFHTKEYGVGWDGTVGNKGDEYVKEGVYIYKVKYKDKEGKIHHKTGHVTLLK
ncbi:MAG: gliding motility-associated C-terminal domain-containing protein [Bacteroidia bacterium]